MFPEREENEGLWCRAEVAVVSEELDSGPDKGLFERVILFEPYPSLSELFFWSSAHNQNWVSWLL